MKEIRLSINGDSTCFKQLGFSATQTEKKTILSECLIDLCLRSQCYFWNTLRAAPPQRVPGELPCLVAMKSCAAGSAWSGCARSARLQMRFGRYSWRQGTDISWTHWAVHCCSSFVAPGLGAYPGSVDEVFSNDGPRPKNPLVLGLLNLVWNLTKDCSS